MLIKQPTDIKPSEITPESVYRSRRKFMTDGMQMLAAGTVAGILPAGALAQSGDQLKARAPASLRRSISSRHLTVRLTSPARP